MRRTTELTTARGEPNGIVTANSHAAAEGELRGVGATTGAAGEGGGSWEGEEGADTGRARGPVRVKFGGKKGQESKGPKDTAVSGFVLKTAS